MSQYQMLFSPADMQQKCGDLLASLRPDVQVVDLAMILGASIRVLSEVSTATYLDASVRGRLPGGSA
jgi:hypothetical protein